MKSKEDLNKLFGESSETFKPDFAKMRSSLLLIAGDHYNKRGANRAFERIRASNTVSNDAKIRLTKNHVGKIARRTSNIIVSSAPNVSIKPKHERELQDQKTAELNQAVWADGKEKNDWQNLVLEWADDYTGVGEVWTKAWFNAYGGAVLGYNQALDPAGQPLFDEMGQPLEDLSSPVYEGRVEFETVYGFNVLCDVNAKDVRKAAWYCIRKMVQTDDLKKTFPDKADLIQDTEDDTFMVFDVNAGYRNSKKGECLLKEWYFRPCAKYPKGWYAIQQNDGVILDEGELPEGIFPIECERYEYVQTKPRGIACTEPLRPYQLEVNRGASKIAEHQVTLGDDKLVMINGSKLSAGASLPGVRTMSVTGQAPIVIEGRSGSQYADYVLSQIKEMYEIAEIDDKDLETGNMDPHTLLYRAARQKKVFQRYINRFETYLIRVCRLYLKMAKYYMSDDAVVAAVGKNEAINVSEFKTADDASLRFIVEPQSEDVETKLGRQIQINHVLQYVGTQMSESSIGKLIAQMPYANVKDAFSDLTLDYECATNDLLALDRGELPPVNPYDPHEYMVKRATSRVREADFRFLPEEVKANYEGYITAHMNAIAAQKEALVRANAGFIPDGGAQVGVDLYVTDPKNPDRTRRARVPQAAAEWLLQKLQDQGAYQSQMSEVPEGAVEQAVLSQPPLPNAMQVAM